MYLKLHFHFLKSSFLWLCLALNLHFGVNFLYAQAIAPGSTYNSATHLCSISPSQAFVADSSLVPQFAQPLPSGSSYGCLGSGNSHHLKRPHWFTFQATSSGLLSLIIQPTLNNDLDFALFGPFSNLPFAANLGTPIQCSNSTVLVDTINIGVSVNQYYVLLVTNPEGRNGNFSFIPNSNVNTASIGSVLSFNPNLPSSVLVCASPFLLETFPSSSNISGLRFSGPGVDSISGLFNPSNAGVGTHLIQVSGSLFGCQGVYSASYFVTVTALPSVTNISVNPTNLTGGSSLVSLNAQVSPPGIYSYIWSGPSGVALPATASWQTNTPGWYSVRAVPDPMTNPACSESLDSVFVYQGPNVSLNGNDTVCWQLNPNISGGTVNTIPNGVTVTSYQWQRKLFNTTSWININNQNSPSSLTVIDASGRQSIRLSAQLSNGVLVTSNEIDIVVLPAGIAPILSLDPNYSQNTTICLNEAVGLKATPATGSGGNFLYRWQRQVGNNWVDIFTPALQADLETQFANLTQTTSYRVIAEDVSGIGCPSLISNTLVINVHGLVTPGSVTASDTSLCFGQNVTIRNVQSGTVSLGGLLNYVWEESLDQAFWSPIPGQTADSLVTPSYTSGQRRFYRRRIYSSLNNVLCPINLPAVSNIVSVIWLQDYPFLSLSPQFGFTGPYVHSIWQANPSTAVSGLSDTTVTITANATSNSNTSAQYLLPSGNIQNDGIVVFNYTPGSSTGLTSVSHTLLVGTGAVNLGAGGTFYVKVLKDQALAFRIAFNNPQTQSRQLQGLVNNFKFFPNGVGKADTICPGNSYSVNGAVVSTSSTSANWVWSKVSGAGSLTGSLTGSSGAVPSVVYQSTSADAGNTVILKLKATRTSSSCQGYADSILVRLYVTPAFVPASFDSSSNKSICFQGNPGILAARPATGGSGPYEYQWQFRNVGASTWSSISGATSLQYVDTTSNLTISREYRIRTTDLGRPSCGQQSISSNVLTLTVLNPLVAPSFVSGPNSHLYLCPNSSAVELRANPASGGSNDFNYLWEFVDSVNTFGLGSLTDSIINLWPWEVVPGATGLLNTTPTLSSGSTRYYRVVANSNPLGSLPACGSAKSQPHRVSVLDVISPTIVAQPQVSVYANASGTAFFDCAETSTLNNGSNDNCAGPVGGFVLRKLSDGPVWPRLNNCPVPIGLPINGNYFNTAYQVYLPYTESLNTTNTDFSSTYSGNNAQPSPDVFIRFNSGSYDSIALSSCNSSFDTYLHLLDGCGNYVAGNNDDGPLCTGISASIYRRVHPNSDYVLVVEGFGNSTGVADISIRGLSYCPVFSCQKNPDTAVFYGYDESGNLGSTDVLINIIDTLGPVLRTQDVFVYLDQNGTATSDPNRYNNGSTDNCTPSNLITFQISPSNYSCTDLGNNVAILVGTDLSGNSSSASVNTIVVDTIRPNASARHLQIVYLDSLGTGQLNRGLVDSFSTDNCYIDTLYSVPLSGWSSFTSGIQGCSSCPLDFNYNCSDVDTLFPAGLVVIDQSNNVDTAFYSILVKDTLPPHVLTYPASAVYIKSAEDCQELYYWQEGLTYADNCSGPVQMLNQAINGISVVNYPFLLLPKGNHRLTFTLVDSRGNSRDFLHEFSVIDTIPPVLLNIPSDFVVSADSLSCGAVVSWVPPTGSDNCAGYVVNSNYSPGQFFPTGNHLVVYTITDGANIVGTDTFQVSVVDQRAPIVTSLNPRVYLGLNGLVTLPIQEIISAFDLCSGVSYSINGASVIDVTLNCGDLGLKSLFITVTDSSGNSTTSSHSVFVLDTLRPILSVNNPVNLVLGPNGLVSLSVSQVNTGSTDNCGIVSMTLSDTLFGCTELGLNQVEFRVLDASGNQSSMTINVNVTDVTPPIVNAILPVNQIYLNSLGSAVIPNSAVLIRATDNCSIDSVIPVSLNFTCNDLRQPLSPVLRTLTVKDKAGNSTNIAISFIVQDTIRPTATPLTRILYLGSNGTVNVSSSALVSASDNCGISTYNPPSYSFACTSATSHQLSVTVSDLSGNSQVVTSQVVVSDTTRPVLSVVDTVNLVLGSNGLSTLNIGQVDLGSTDNCGIVGRFLSKTSFNCSNLGINNVEFRALDAVGNLAFKWFVVRVIDNTPPTASALPSSPVYLNSQGFVTVNTANLIQATDNCMVDSILPTSFTFTCSDVLNPVGSVQRIIRVKDRSGNVTSLTVPFTIIDTVRPNVVPVNFTAYLTANGTVSVSGTSLVSMNDNCCIATVTPSIINYTCASTYSNNVLVNVTDCNGNSRSVTSQVTIFDTIRPVVLYNDTVRLTLGSNGIATMSLSQVDLGSYDNCNIVSRTLSKTLFNCTDVGLNQVEFRLIDQSGNLSFVWVNVLVRDLTPPSATAIPNLTAYLNSQGVASLNSANLVIVSDNCQVDSILPLTQNFTCADVSNPVAPVFRQIVVKDKAGNATVVNVLISVLDTIRPTAIPLNRTIYLNSQGTATLLTSTLAHVADNCCISSYTPSTVSFNCSNVGSSANNVQFTVTDCHNNSRTVSVQVVVVDTVAPTVTTQPRTLYLNNQCQVVASSSQLVSASDACGVASYDPVYFTFGRSDCGSRDTVTITVRDFHQNERVVTVPLLVLDTIKPVVVSTPPLMDTVSYCESRVVYSMPVGSDNCGMVQVTQTAGLPSGSVFPTGLTTNRFNLTDECGNVTEVICSIFVKNFTLPFIPNNYTFCTTDSSVLLSNGINGFVFSGPGVISNRFYPTLAPSGVLPINWIFTNNDGCDSSGSISIDLIEAPTIAEIVRMSPTLLRVSQPYFGYQWHRYGTPIAGATSRDLNISQAGVYSVDVMSIGGCFRMSPPIGIGVGVGIDEVVESYDLFYPNPSDGVFNLLFNSKIGSNPVLEVFDALGRSVYLKGLSFEDQIDLSHLANGKYMAVVRSSNASIMQSLIIK